MSRNESCSVPALASQPNNYRSVQGLHRAHRERINSGWQRRGGTVAPALAQGAAALQSGFVLQRPLLALPQHLHFPSAALVFCTPTP
jgi:hypothetical protein